MFILDLKYYFSLTVYNVSIYDRFYSRQWTHMNLEYMVE